MKKSQLLVLLMPAAALLLTSCSSKKAQEESSSLSSAQEDSTHPDNSRAVSGPIQLTFLSSAGYELPYCLYLPENMEEGVSYPLVLFLHGAGERGSDNLSQTNDTGIIPYITDSAFYAQNPSIILVPQCPEEEQWVNTPWTDGSYSIDEVPVSDSLAAVTELLSEIMTEYPADPSRVYGAGVSMGGYGTWDMLLRSPDTFAAAVILCGAGDPSMADAVKDIPVWLFHGSLDEEVPPSGSRDMAEALIQAGAADVRYREYADYGHWIWLSAYEEPGLLAWLFSQERG